MFVHTICSIRSEKRSGILHLQPVCFRQSEFCHSRVSWCAVVSKHSELIVYHFKISKFFCFYIHFFFCSCPCNKVEKSIFRSSFVYVHFENVNVSNCVFFFVLQKNKFFSKKCIVFSGSY